MTDLRTIMSDPVRFFFGGQTYLPRRGEIVMTAFASFFIVQWTWSLATSPRPFETWSSLWGAPQTWPWVLAIAGTALALLEVNRGSRGRMLTVVRFITHTMQLTAAVTAIALLVGGTAIAFRVGDMRTTVDLYLIAASGGIAVVLPYQHETVLERRANRQAPTKS